MQGSVARVAATEAARDVLRQLVAQHGPLLSTKSGGTPNS